MQLWRVLTSVLAITLWIVTAAVGLWEIVVVREMVFRIYARFWGGSVHHVQAYWAAQSLGNWVVLVLGIVWLAFVIGTAEYHRKRVGQRSSWRLFGLTGAVELAILILAYFV